jgi:hypothetical protein
MEIADIIPADGEPQRIYCPNCEGNCELAYIDFDEEVSGIRIRINSLPTLRCPACGTENLPDPSRFAILELHKKAIENGSSGVNVQRRKRDEDFGFAKVKFLYDPDDYYYIPGLTRPWDKGFLQPVFFKRGVLLKYDNSPEYSVQFASTTYGTIYTDGQYISFGVNRNGLLVMWLGDIAKMPEEEQHYLRSENVASDHSIGSEFYDGQIEVKFTDPSRESRLFKSRSAFLDAAFVKFGKKIAHLDKETFEISQQFNPPLVDTKKERRHVADALNKIYIESLDNASLEKIGKAVGAEEMGSGSLKRLQALLQKVAPEEDIGTIVAPLYVLYDLRVAYSHLTSSTTAKRTLEKVCNRLGIPDTANLTAVYGQLTINMIDMFARLTDIIKRIPSIATAKPEKKKAPSSKSTKKKMAPQKAQAKKNPKKL